MMRIHQHNLIFKHIKYFRKNIGHSKLGASISFFFLHKDCHSDSIPVMNNVQFNFSVSPHACKYLSTSQPEVLSEQFYNTVSDETLESLSEFFEELFDTNPNLSFADVSFSVSRLIISLYK